MAHPHPAEAEESECGEEHHGQIPTPPSVDVVGRASATFRALGDPARLLLLDRLSHGERCVSDLAQESKEGMSTVSQRLRILRSERLVTRRREGKHIYYALADAHVTELLRSCIEHAAEEYP